MAFEKFTKTGRAFKPKASIWSRGQIGFNQGAVERFSLERFDYVVLFYDKEEKRIGFQFTNDKDGEGINKLNVKKTGAVVSGKAFLDYYEINHDKTKNYDLRREEDLFVIDLA